MSGKIYENHVADLLLKLIEIEDPEKSEKQVMIEKAICLKQMCDYVISCSYGDVVLIIAMLRDYVKMLDEVKGDDITYKAYYRNKFLQIANRLSGQIDYDYDKAVENCHKKQRKKKKDNDIGEDAMVLAVTRGKRPEKHQQDDTPAEENDCIPETVVDSNSLMVP